MKKIEREEMILNQIKVKKFLTTKEYYKITNELGVTSITARRDLQNFQDLGYINLNYGAIEIVDEIEKTRNQKKQDNVKQKTSIAKTAVSLLNSNDIIYVSPGTTMEAFVRNINLEINTLVTNGLEVFNVAKLNRNIKNTILIGGRYRLKSSAFVGRDSITVLDNYQFTKSFFTGTNIDNNLDIFNDNDQESMIFNKALSKSKAKIGLFDSSKFSSTGISFVASLKELDLIISDNLLNDDNIEKINKVSKLTISK